MFAKLILLADERGYDVLLCCSAMVCCPVLVGRASARRPTSLANRSSATGGTRQWTIFRSYAQTKMSESFHAVVLLWDLWRITSLD